MTLTSRRGFIRKGAVAAAGLPAIAATLASCKETKADSAPANVGAPPPALRTTPRQKADEMDAMHEKGVKAFPAKTAGKGNQLMEPRLEEGVKVYELAAEEIQWEVEPGRKVKAWAYNGQVPGPQIRVREGDRVRVDPDEQAPGVHGDSLSRPRAAERSGRRAVHHAAADQAGRDLHLRVHGAERRLAHVPLAPQRGEAGRAGAARRVHRRAESARARIERATSTTS